MGQIATKDLAIGRGQLSFAKHASSDPTTVPNGFRDLGNAPTFTINVTTEQLEHRSSRGGLNQKDDETIISQTFAGSITLDSVGADNLATFFLSDAETVTEAATTSATETWTDLEYGYIYQLGITDARPFGFRNVSITSVLLVSDDSPLVEGTDYVLDATRGTLTFIEGSSVLTTGELATGVEVTYDVDGGTYKVIKAGKVSQILGAMKFDAYNPKGENIDYFFPKVKLRPSGDIALISDEYMTVTLEFEAQTMGDLYPVYANGEKLVV